MDPSARMAFNMKVLKRHDPSIEEIIESASFVVLYSHDGEWTKTGIEGPMFLYRRSTIPSYGFFVLNRNGVENYSANLALDDDLELTTEFIIYRASQGEDVVGIWIFEPSQRDSVGQQMLKLQATPSSATIGESGQASTTEPSSQAGQSISLDALFGGPAQKVTPAVPTSAAGPASQNGLSLLESIFQSASSSKASASSETFPPQAVNSPPDGAEGLKAMLGLQRSAPAPGQGTTISATAPSGLDVLFASTDMGTTPEKTKGDSVNGTSSTTSAIVDASLQAKELDGTALPDSLSRGDFVREVLSLIHTDKAFVDDMYHRYRSRRR